MGDAIAACGRGDYLSAREHNQEALKMPWLTKALMTWYMPVSSVILAHEGEKERAAEIVGLVLTHPLSPSGWIEKWPLFSHLRADLELELGSEAYQAAWERGMALDPDQVITGLLDS
jgi:hypothetical protein